MDNSVIPASGIRTSATGYFSRLRLHDILVLQGPPLLGAAFAIAHLRTLDIGAMLTLLAGNLFLMTHVFMVNDWADVAADLSDPNKAENVFTARGLGTRAIAGLTTALLAISLLIFSRLGALPVALALAIAALSALYSLPQFNWKGKPLLNSAAHLFGGILHFFLGYCLGHAVDGRGVAIASYFALIFAAGHLTQEVRDYTGDVRNGVQTNAVSFGPRRTFVASVVLFASAHVLFLVLALQKVLPLPLAAVVVLFPIQLYWSSAALSAGLTYASVSRLRGRYRMLYAFIGLCIVTALVVARIRAIAL